MKHKRFKNGESNIQKFRKKWLKRGIELINITSLCEAKLGCSGWCNNFNEPDDEIFHIQIYYRNEVIANITPKYSNVIDDVKHVLYVENYDKTCDSNFIIFKKVRIK